MTLGQKAKAYDEALEKAKSWYVDAQINFKKSLETLFPVLKESEDERMRKMCIEYLDRWCQDCSFADDIKNVEKCIAWLEKQGEQKQDVSIQISPSEYVNDMGGNGCYLKNTTQTFTWSKKEEKVDNFKNYMKEE